MNSRLANVESDWRSIAEELATALQDAVLRNPSVTARDWNRAQIALGRYEEANGAKPAGSPPADSPDVLLD